MVRQIRIWIIFALCLLFVMTGIPEWMEEADSWWYARSLAYSFYHANAFHLAVNCLAIWTVFSPGHRNVRDLVTGFIIAVAVHPLAMRPVIGFSNLLYAVLGTRTPELSSPWWRTPTTITFLAVTVALLFFPQFSALTHIAAFIMGMMVAGARRIIRSISHDADRIVR